MEVLAPQIGQKIYDGAAGSCGFLVEAFDYLSDPANSGKKSLSVKDSQQLQKSTFYAKEKKSLAYIIGTMNMILHGIEAPNLDELKQSLLQKAFTGQLTAAAAFEEITV